jgi:hypothetical protein
MYIISIIILIAFPFMLSIVVGVMITKYQQKHHKNVKGELTKFLSRNNDE